MKKAKTPLKKLRFSDWVGIFFGALLFMFSSILFFSQFNLRDYLFESFKEEEEPLGEVESIQGEVSREPYGSNIFQKLHSHDLVYNKDLIGTAKNSSILLKMKDGSTFSLNAQTMIQLNFKPSRFTLEQFIARKSNRLKVIQGQVDVENGKAPLLIEHNEKPLLIKPKEAQKVQTIHLKKTKNQTENDSEMEQFQGVTRLLASRQVNQFKSEESKDLKEFVSKITETKVDQTIQRSIASVPNPKEIDSEAIAKKALEEREYQEKLKADLQWQDQLIYRKDKDQIVTLDPPDFEHPLKTKLVKKIPLAWVLAPKANVSSLSFLLAEESGQEVPKILINKSLVPVQGSLRAHITLKRPGIYFWKLRVSSREEAPIQGPTSGKIILKPEFPGIKFQGAKFLGNEFISSSIEKRQGSFNKILLKWNTLPEKISSHLQISSLSIGKEANSSGITDNKMEEKTVLIDQMLQQEQFKLDVSKIDEKGINYRVEMMLGNGFRAFSPSEKFFFELTAPKPVYPRNNTVVELAKNTADSIILTWKVGKWNRQFKIWIARDQSFVNLVTSAVVEDNYLNCSNLSEGTYYWRVQGLKNKLESPMSPTFSFQVKATIQSMETKKEEDSELSTYSGI